MKTVQIFRQSLRAITHNKGRSFLTSLGIIIGIASVITLLALGQGAQNSITGRLAQLGTTTITIRSGQVNFALPNTQSRAGQQQIQQQRSNFGQVTRPTLTQADLDDLKRNMDKYNLRRVAGYISDAQALTVKEKDAEGKDQQVDFTVVGTEPDYFDIQRFEVDKGRRFTEEEVVNKAKVVVVGSAAAKDIFGEAAQAIGKTLLFGTETYEVIGVMQPKDESGFINPNNQIYGPVSALSQTLNYQNYSTIYAAAKNEASVDSAKKAIEDRLQELHKKTPKTRDFTVISQKDLLSTITSAVDTFKVLLTGIAGISLVVGGIGIMNIMLVAVTERTREIGLRKAVGARTQDILLQFMIEAMLLCLVGGIVGVGLGTGLSSVLGRLLSSTTGGFVPEVSIASVVLAVSVAVVVGLVFGIYPAAKAARLNPIDALRYE